MRHLAGFLGHAEVVGGVRRGHVAARIVGVPPEVLLGRVPRRSGLAQRQQRRRSQDEGLAIFGVLGQGGGGKFEGAGRVSQVKPAAGQ
jgi:hypothetical protein